MHILFLCTSSREIIINNRPQKKSVPSTEANRDLNRDLIVNIFVLMPVHFILFSGYLLLDCNARIFTWYIILCSVVWQYSSRLFIYRLPALATVVAQSTEISKMRRPPILVLGTLSCRKYANLDNCTDCMFAV